MPKPSSTGIRAYNIDRWSDGYVDISNDGDLRICPHRDSDSGVALTQVLAGLKEHGLRLPALVRFKSILHDRVNCLVNSFNTVAAELSYEGQYKIVYPIKVNQQRRVVEEITQAQPARQNKQLGLEAGSKPELLAVLAQNLDVGSVIVCNGYKDRAYIRMALLGQKLGYTVYIVAEKISELRLIIEEARHLSIVPNIGIRARLSTIGKGNWQNTGGEKSKFGLSASQMLQAIDYLRAEGALDTLTLLHFHLGSQIANIRDIHRGLQECAQVYSQLRHIGAPIGTVDIGGGLGVDYDGTASRNVCSINYELTDYARTVLQAFKEEAERSGLPHPDIISESGRALTAHHAILLADVVAREHSEHSPVPDTPDLTTLSAQHLWQDYQALKTDLAQRSPIEIYHDAAHAFEEANSLFAQGHISLQQKAEAETLYTAICKQLIGNLDPEHRDHREIIDTLNEKLADKIFVNFSLFQSLPDIWGIDQIFPILPIRGLNQPLSRRAILQDITCDSDGRIDHYVSSRGIETSLQLPEHASNDEPEVLCFFMVGAYQEILGDMHNLFGDTDSVDASIDESGRLSLEHAIRGDTISKALQYVHLQPDVLMQNYRSRLETLEMSDSEREACLLAFEHGLESYTYLQQE